VTCVDCKIWDDFDVSTTFPHDIKNIFGSLTDLNPLDDIDITLTFDNVGGLLRLMPTLR
jgi:hypothetical protein